MFDVVIIVMVIFSGDSYQVPQDGAGDGPWEVDGSKIHLGWSRQEAPWLCSKGEIWQRIGFKLTNQLLLSFFYRSSATTHSTGNFKWTTIDKYERDLFTFDMGIEESMKYKQWWLGSHPAERESAIPWTGCQYGSGSKGTWWGWWWWWWWRQLW